MFGLVERSDTAAADSQPAATKPPARSGGLTVTPDRAVTLDGVYRSLSIIETGAHQLSLDVWRTLNGVTTPLEQTPAIIAQPNIDESGPAFYASTCVSLAARGNAYWRKTYAADGMSVINLELLDPLTVTPARNRNGQIVFHTAESREPLTRREIQHLKLLRLPGQLVGLGPVQAAQRQLSGQLNMRDYADSWFNEGTGHTDAVLSTTQDLTQDQARRYKELWQESQSMGDGPAVMGAGLSYNVLSLKPAEVQWIEAQQFGITGIARLFGIPASLLLASVEGTSLTYKNQEQEDLAFVRFTLMRYLREMEDAFTQLLPRTQVARFNVDALLRSDTKTRYDAHKIGIDAGFLDPAEVRAMEGLPAREITAPERNPAA